MKKGTKYRQKIQRYTLPHIHTFPLLGVPQEQQVMQPWVYAEALAQTHTAPKFVTVVSVCPKETWLLYSVGFVHLVPSTPLAPKSSPSTFYGVLLGSA